MAAIMVAGMMIIVSMPPSLPRACPSASAMFSTIAIIIAPEVLRVLSAVIDFLWGQLLLAATDRRPVRRPVAE
jgi:hypothetical protein